MPVRYQIDGSQGLVFTEFSGEITYSMIALHFTSMRSDHSFKPHFSEVLDLTGVTRHMLRNSDFYHLAEHDPFSPTAQRAIVVTRDEAFEVAKLYQIVREGPSVRRFCEREAALQWLSSHATKR
jgi:hypothetical protein